MRNACGVIRVHNEKRESKVSFLILVGGGKDGGRGPRALRIVRVAAEPREAGLLRQVAQSLTVAEPCLILAVRERRGFAVFKLVAVATTIRLW